MITRRALLAAPLALAGARAAAQAPAAVANGAVVIGSEAIVRAPDGLWRVAVAMPDLPAEVRDGRAGHHGDLYDNRDDGHSEIDIDDHPGLVRIVYGSALRRQGLHLGANRRFLFDRVVVGNASMAVTGVPVWRSLPRLMMTAGDGPRAMAAHYAANHLYVYPAHRDIDGDGVDLMPAQTAQIVVTLGSSGSDRPFVDALLRTLAAMPAATKRVLAARGLIAPTAQMILRRSLRGVRGEADYLSARAHPVAFRREDLDVAAMTARAAALSADAAPPAPRLTVLSEPPLVPGVSLFGDGLSERLFDTPDAVARVARGVAGLRSYRLSVSGTRDPAGRPLRFHWRVLRGEGATVTPLDAAGAEAMVMARWTPPSSAPDTTPARIDVMAVAEADGALSAPAFFSLLHPPGQRRRHQASGAPLEIDYAPSAAAERYADPVVFAKRAWRDVYASDGGWTRTHVDGAVERFTRHGHLVIETDAQNRPLHARAVAYPLVSAPDRGVRVTPTLTTVRFRYAYAGPDDNLGVLRRAPSP